MKIAYFSPMPPARTGIATYSSYLVPELAARCDVTVFSPDVSDWRAPANCRVVNFRADPFILKSLDEYDQVVYHLGNNPWFHLDIYQAFLQRSGLVVLHDLVLYYLIAGLGHGGMIKEFCQNYGHERLEEVWELIVSCPGKDILRYQRPARYPFLHRVLEHARGIIVHNHSSAEQLAQIGRVDRVHVLPLIYYPEQRWASSHLNREILRRETGVGADEVLLGVFGFIGPTKRIGQVLQAVRRLLDENPRFPIRVLIVGEGDSLKEEIAASCLGDRVIELGFVADEKFAAYLDLVDIVANLRYPSMGEGSATLMQAMSFGKPVIVTNHAFFSEFPDDVVAKVSYGENEIDEIANILKRLVENDGEREQLGVAARRYVETYCAPDKVADLYLDIFQNSPNSRMPNGKEQIPNQAVAPPWGEQYLYQRLSSLMPSRISTM
jgi:glycosyltransferase involved in cell wall biosynthesis